ncbi:TPM domain-containing protein [Sungkyunkwania multivorans]|uniref:TPM domain-containing protein n=1 Tax=Sungkyunkwania multivorans TaxID=1173618 RepID=A0ABW3D3H3_9FLAO
MSAVENFLTAEEEQEIIAAIRRAENETSGEIRVHLEPSTKGMDALEHAKEIFHWLKMDNTKDENGVLIYVAVTDHTFAIYGDKGIDKRVPKGFWDTTRDHIAAEFKRGNFKQGLVNGIIEAGEQLQAHFPWHHGDKNELPNDISKGE